MAELIFKTTLKEVPVTIDDKPYIVRELDGQALSNWRKTDGSTISVDEAGKATIQGLNIKDPEIELLSICLFDMEEKLVPQTTIKKWGATALQGLYKVAQELNGLTRESRQKQEDKAKNS